MKAFLHRAATWPGAAHRFPGAIRAARISALAIVAAGLILAPVLSTPGEAAPKKVVLDPGHGWCPPTAAAGPGCRVDPGAVNGAVQEKDVVLDVANRTKALLEARGYVVELTRTGDDPARTLSHAAVAVNSRAPELAVSIHVNAGRGTGTEACYQDRKATTEASKQLSQRLVANISGRLGLRSRGIFSEYDGGRCGNGRQLYIHDMNPTAALIELAFIDTADDLDKLLNRKQDFAQAIADAIDTQLGGSGGGGNGGGNGGSPTVCPTGQFRAQYFNNRSLSGAPAFTRCETGIGYDWGNGGPGNGVGSDNFSVRWVGRFHFEAGSYTFIGRADDGLRVRLDGAPVIDAWRDQGPTEYRVARTVAAGDREIAVEYYENGGGAVAQVRWERGSPPPTTPGPTPRREVIVDDRSADFSRSGRAWWEANGYNGRMFWTYVNGSVVSSAGEWRATLAGGRYEVYVFVPRANATSRSAKYEIFTSGGTATRSIDQNAHYDAWVSLGTYDFRAGTERRVRLTDATGESPNTRRKLGFDAIKLVPR